MAYALSTTRVDELAFTGFLGGVKSWAHVLHGVVTATTGGPTSTQLMSAAATKWTAQIAPLLPVFVTITQITARQITGIKPRVGSFYRVSLTVAAGVITGATVVGAGSGYDNGTRPLTIYDTTGSGGDLVGTFTGGSLASVAVVTGGTGFTAPVVVAELPPSNTLTPNRFEWTYGSADVSNVSLAGTDLGDYQPNFTAYSIRLRSSAPGRYGRSAAHWPNVPEARTTGNALTGATVTAANGAATNMYTISLNVAGTTWPPCTYSRTLMARQLSPGTVSVASPYASIISTAICNGNIGSMLRRKLKI